MKIAYSDMFSVKKSNVVKNAHKSQIDELE